MVGGNVHHQQCILPIYFAIQVATVFKKNTSPQQYTVRSVKKLSTMIIHLCLLLLFFIFVLVVLLVMVTEVVIFKHSFIWGQHK